MSHLFEVTNGGEHRQHRLDQHPYIPSSFFAHLEIGRITPSSVEAGIAEDAHLTVELFDQSAKVLVVGIGRRAIPTHDVTQMIEYKRQFTSHDPASAGQPFLADLGRAVTFTNRVNQFDAVAVGYAQQTGLC